MPTSKKRPATKPNQQQTVVHQQTTVVWSGPISPPDDLRKINDLVPGAAERILIMAEKEQEKRHQIERLAVEKEIDLARAEQTDFRRG
jgi:uncharacterized membrane protein